MKKEANGLIIAITILCINVFTLVSIILQYKEFLNFVALGLDIFIFAAILKGILEEGNEDG